MSGDGDRAERWLMAAVTLDADPSARVECPACGMETLRFEEMPSEPGAADAEPGVERILRCGFCGAAREMGRGPV